MLLILFEYAELLVEQISYRDVSLVRCDVRKARTNAMPCFSVEKYRVRALRTDFF